jgi:hypothetical protein
VSASFLRGFPSEKVSVRLTQMLPRLGALLFLIAIAVSQGSSEPRSPSDDRQVLRQSIPAHSASAPVSSAAVNAGPLTEYYLTAGDQGTNWVVQGITVTASFPQHHPEDQGEYAIAVTDTVRTLGNGNVALGRVPSHAGSEYTLSGIYTGTDFVYPVDAFGFYDGATDGRFNYSVDFYGGGVYRFNSNWSNPVLLFPTAPGYMGITFDIATNTLWLSFYNGNMVEHRSLTGAVISSFSVAATPSALALDPADGTLWLTAQQPQGILFQYSQSGVPLGSVAYPELVDQNTLGGEFAVPPVAATKGNAHGSGTITVLGGTASFRFSERLPAKKTHPFLAYSDPTNGFSFNTKKLGPVTITGRHAHFTGSAKLRKRTPAVTFTIEVADLSGDGTGDEFSIIASNGYSAGGTLTSGNIVVTQ